MYEYQIAKRVGGDNRISDDQDSDFDIPCVAAGNATGDDDGFVLDPTSACGLRKRSHRREWLVEGIAVAGQPLVCGGPSKTLKTSMLLDLGISISAQATFLGKFPVPRQRMVLMLSGESDRETIAETYDRIWKTKAIDPYDDEKQGCIVFEFRLPQLANRRHLKEVRRVIINEGAEVVIVDPDYLCLRGVQTSNSMVMGPIYRAFADTCLEVGCTPILTHHFRRSRQALAKPELADLSHAGIEEFARQWMLLGRRKHYLEGSGRHELWLSVGGSAGHSDTWAVDVDEGQLAADFTGRRWDVKVLTPEELQQQDAAAKDKERHSSQDAKQHDDDVTLLSKLDELDPARYGVRQREFRKALGWGGQRIGSAIGRLVEVGHVEVFQQASVSGKGREIPSKYVRRVAQTHP